MYPEKKKSAKRCEKLSYLGIYLLHRSKEAIVRHCYILTGGPGTGKTDQWDRTIVCWIERFQFRTIKMPATNSDSLGSTDWSSRQTNERNDSAKWYDPSFVRLERTWKAPSISQRIRRRFTDRRWDVYGRYLAGEYPLKSIPTNMQVIFVGIKISFLLWGQDKSFMTLAIDAIPKQELTRSIVKETGQVLFHSPMP